MNNYENNELIFVRLSGNDVEFLEPEEIAALLYVVIKDPILRFNIIICIVKGIRHGVISC